MNLIHLYNCLKSIEWTNDNEVFFFLEVVVAGRCLILMLQQVIVFGEKNIITDKIKYDYANSCRLDVIPQDSRCSGYFLIKRWRNKKKIFPKIIIV
jgi:hypothetical protein